MRRSSVSGVAPLRVKNDNQASSGSSSSGTRSSFGYRSSSGSRSSFGKHDNRRPSTGNSTSSSAHQTQPKRRKYSMSYGHNELKQDPRPTSSRPFKERCIRELLEFLGRHGYPYPYSPKLLHSPPSKDFMRIFEFMYSLIEPGFKCSSKIEEHFPETLKALGYPFIISKSAMYAVGSPHTWPTLLAALDWLRTQIEYITNTPVESILFPMSEDSFDTIPTSKILYKYCESSYRQFLGGADTFEELENNLEKDIVKNSQAGDIEGLIHAERRLTQELENLEKQSDPIINLKDDLSNVNLDEDKINQYLNKLTQHSEQQTSKQRSIDEEEKAQRAELSLLHTEISRKRRILDTQVFSQSDVQRINMERRALQKENENLETENTDLQKLVWEEERQLAKKQEQIQKKCATFNTNAHIVQIVPIAASNSGGIDFTMQPNLEPKHSHYFNNTIKPALFQLKNQAIDKTSELQQTKFIGQNTGEQLADKIEEKQLENTSFEKQIAKLDVELESTKTHQSQEATKLQESMDHVQEELKSLHRASNVDLAQLEKSTKQSKLTLDQLRVDHKQAEKKIINFIHDAAAMIIDHKAKIQAHTQVVLKEFEDQLAEERAKVIELPPRPQRH